MLCWQAHGRTEPSALRALVLSDPVIPLLGMDHNEAIKDSPSMASIVLSAERKVPAETELSLSQAVSTVEYYAAGQTQEFEGRLRNLGKCSKEKLGEKIQGRKPHGGRRAPCLFRACLRKKVPYGYAPK